jgi:hypothetical protein
VQGGAGHGTADTQVSTTPRGNPPKKTAIAKGEGGRGQQQGGRVSGGGHVSLSSGQKKVHPKKGVSLAWWLYSQMRRQNGGAAPVSPPARKSPPGIDAR